MSRRKRKTSGTLRKTAWSAEERRAFSDNRLRALTVPARRFNGPTISEWR